MKPDPCRRRALHLTRHGHAGEPGPKRFIGRTDLPLSEEGRQQAERLRVLFSDVPLDRIVSSDLSRAIESARIIAGGRREQPVALPAFREIDLGEWDGQAFEDIRTRSPHSFRERGLHLDEYRPPGGESFSDLRNRVIPALDRLVRETTGDLLVVAHAGVNRVILCHLLGIPLTHLFRIAQDHGAVNTVQLAGRGGVRVKAVNFIPGIDAFPHTHGRDG